MPEMQPEQSALLTDATLVYMNSGTNTRDTGYRCAQDRVDLVKCTCGFADALGVAAEDLHREIEVEREGRRQREVERVS